jgi:hypothetical protein
MLGLGMLEIYYVAHQILEPDCPAHTSNNPNACYFCSHLSFIAIEAAPSVVPPVRPDAQVTVIAARVDRILSADILQTPARSPPVSL